MGWILGLYLSNYAGALIGAYHKLDSIQIHSAMTNPPEYSNRLVASGWKKFNLNLRS